MTGKGRAHERQWVSVPPIKVLYRAYLIVQCAEPSDSVDSPRSPQKGGKRASVSRISPWLNFMLKDTTFPHS